PAQTGRGAGDAGLRITAPEEGSLLRIPHRPVQGVLRAMDPLISSPATVSYGAQLNFETLTDEVSLRFHPLQDTLLRVIDGVAELRFDGEEHLLGPGGEALVPAGFHHTLCAVSGKARIVMGFRAARF